VTEYLALRSTFLQAASTDNDLGSMSSSVRQTTRGWFGFGSKRAGGAGRPCSLTKPRILFAAAILAAAEVNCARPTPTVDSDQDHLERLVTRAYGVPVTEGYSYAVATAVCGQEGSHGVAIYLLDHSSDTIPPLTGRYLRLTLFSGWEEAESLPHQSLRWQASRGPEMPSCVPQERALP
jgi:hypothetical protein